MRFPRPLATLLLVVAVVTAGCGDDDGSTAAEGATSTREVTHAMGSTLGIGPIGAGLILDDVERLLVEQ